MISLVRLIALASVCIAVRAGSRIPRQVSQSGPTMTDATSTPTVTSLAELPDISAPAQIGLIMPNPDKPVYVGELHVAHLLRHQGQQAKLNIRSHTTQASSTPLASSTPPKEPLQLKTESSAKSPPSSTFPTIPPPFSLPTLHYPRTRPNT